jgi:hypothetical protein
MVEYMHWQKFDGSFDSVCIKCGAKVGNVKEEASLASLAKYERNHICLSAYLTDRRADSSLKDE